MNIQDKVLGATANPNFRAPKCPEDPLSSVLPLQELFQGAAIDVPVAGIVVQAGMGSRSVGGQLVHIVSIMYREVTQNSVNLHIMKLEEAIVYLLASSGHGMKTEQACI